MSQDENHRAKLTRLADALMEDIIASSDADIIADVDASDIERARTILEDARAGFQAAFGRRKGRTRRVAIEPAARRSPIRPN
jgi:hypothetical protein